MTPYESGPHAKARLEAPDGAADMPDVARAAMQAMVRGWFTDAINTTFVVGVAFCVVGGLCTLLLRSHAETASVADRVEAT